MNPLHDDVFYPRFFWNQMGKPEVLGPCFEDQLARLKCGFIIERGIWNRDSRSLGKPQI